MELFPRPVSALPEGTAYGRYLCGLSMIADHDGLGAVQLAETRWRTTPQVKAALDLYLKGPVAAASTTDATFAQPLVATGLVAEPLAYLQGATIVGALADRLARVPFNMQVALAPTVAIGDWVPEGASTPAAALSYGTVAPLRDAKIGVIVAETQELIRAGTPAADATVRRDTLDGLAMKIDQLFLNPAAVAAPGRPGSITNGTTAITSSGATPDLIRADLNAMGAALTTPTRTPVWIMAPKTALVVANAVGVTTVVTSGAVADSGSFLLGLPVIVHPNAPAQITLIDPGNILLADDGIFEVDVSAHASVQFDTAPTSPPTAATTFRTVFGDNLMSVRSRRWINWQRARAGSVVYMPVTY